MRAWKLDEFVTIDEMIFDIKAPIALQNNTCQRNHKSEASRFGVLHIQIQSLFKTLIFIVIETSREKLEWMFLEKNLM